MKGLELCRKFFYEYGEKMINEEFADIKHLLAAGLVGSGSECFGYDDEVSADHDFDAGFCIFVPDDIDERRLFQLERAYAKLPKEFSGYRREKLSPVGGNRRGVIKTSEFYRSKTGKPDGKLTLEDWLSIPEFYLAEATNGEIYFDALGQFTSIRNELGSMPKDVFYKKLAGNLLIMKQAGSYNYPRILAHGERASAQLAVVEFVKATINVVFLLNGEYAPYYKWTFRALKDLKKFSELSATLEFLLTTDNDARTAATKTALIEDISGTIADHLIVNGLTKATCHDLEKHAYSVNDRIENVSLRNASVLAAV